jgi:hypothetical protein
MEQDAERVSILDGFKAIKKNTKSSPGESSSRGSQLHSFHSAWIIHGAPVTQPAILYGVRQEVTFSPDDKGMDELNDTMSYIQRCLFEMEPGMALSFAKKFKDMIDRKDLNAPVNVQDLPISTSRRRPQKSGKNTFNGGHDVS